MRRLAGLIFAVALLAGCSVAAEEMAAEQENRITFDELTQAMLDPESDVDFADVDGVELGEFARPADSFCEAFAVADLTWLDGAVMPLQALHDAWASVDDVPPAVADDVDVLRAFTAKRIDWNFGRIDRDDRPVADGPMIERLEHIADVAVAECNELPPRVGYPDDWALDLGWEDEEIARRCADSLATLREGIPLYRELRGIDPGHTAQIELAALSEFHRTFDDDVTTTLWFAAELHGLDASGEIVALPPCDDP
jgi:hypothetical protein